MNVDYKLVLDSAFEGYDRETEWFQPRVATVPDGRIVLTMTKSVLWGSDIFSGIYYSISADGGKNWTAPELISNLEMKKLPDGYKEAPADFQGKYHQASGKLLYTGGTACYEPGERGAVSVTESHPRYFAYNTFDPQANRWSNWQRVEMPDKNQFYWGIASCCQRVDLDNGDILQPVYGISHDGIKGNAWTACYYATVVKCRFDGNELKYVEHGDILSIDVPRGFCEPSLTRSGNYFYLTLRNDVRGYVARSKDGLHFAKPIPWKFDDGCELGSYNTQQHWLTHNDRLFLSYTRKGANNDEVIRHRAPLFLAEVDPEKMSVIRETERIVVPNNGAQLGNFGTANISPNESWVVTSEVMHGDAKDPMNLELTEKRGANNRVYLARIYWNIEMGG